MKNLPIVSAIIAAYNEELHISNCINSLLNQTYENIEIFVIENGDSKDETYEIAKEFENKNKKLKAFSIPGSQKGPGNAWNYGISKSKGEIIMICGADLIYGKEYVSKAVDYLIKTGENAVVHNEEKCNNLNNLWARAFFYKRSSLDETGLSKVFTIVKKDYIAKRPFDSGLGYADDQTVFKNEGTRFKGIDLEIYQTNPASFKDTWDHSKWVGRSMEKPYLIILILPVFPLYAIYKTIKHLKIDFYYLFILFLPYYYSVRYFAYFTEAIKKIFKEKK